MLQHKLTIALGIFLTFMSVFFIWHYLLSIYEVKYQFNLQPDYLVLDNEYKIECVGLNSIGWKLKFRDSNFHYSIEQGKEILEIIESNRKNFLIFKLVAKGEVFILLNSKYSLNPTKLLFSVKE